MSSTFKNSPRERVRVAHKLTRAYNRYYGKSNRTVSSALFGICVLDAFGDMSQADTLLNLANVIDPTCSIVEQRHIGKATGVTVEYALSCGHTVNDIDGEPPTYCPICGRRIVEAESGESSAAEPQPSLEAHEAEKGTQQPEGISPAEEKEPAAAEAEAPEASAAETAAAEAIPAESSPDQGSTDIPASSDVLNAGDAPSVPDASTITGASAATDTSNGAASRATNNAA